MKKRAVSKVVAVVLLILITIAAIGILWLVVLPMLNDISSFEEKVSLEILSEGYTAWDAENRLAKIQVKRGVDDAKISGFKLIFEFENDNFYYSVDEEIGFNEKKVYDFNFLDFFSYGELVVVKLVAVYEDGSESGVLSELKIPKKNLSTKTPSGGYISPPPSGSGGSGGAGGSGGSEVEQKECDLTTARWNASSVVENKLVRLIIDGNNCQNERINYTIIKIGELSWNPFNWFNRIVFSGTSSASMNWLAGQRQDGVVQTGTYRFEATLSSDGTEKIVSGNLVVADDDCVSNCSGKECGDDGCGGSCGSCGSGEECSDGKCVEKPVTPTPATICEIDFDCSGNGPGFFCNDDKICEYKPPIGIPKPTFGIEETYRMYDEEENRNPELTYHQNSEGGFYTHYVDNSVTCVDGNNNGTIENPMCKIPNYLEEGSVVEIHGGPYGPTIWMRGTEGTKERPIFVRGVGMPRVNKSIEVSYYGNASYVIYEGLDLLGIVLSGRAVTASFTTNHIAIRHSKVGDQGGISIDSNTPNFLNNMVLYNIEVSERGIWDPDIAEGDRDMHAIGVGGKVSYLWILDSEMYHCEGDGVQINSNPSSVSHHIYIGRNHAHHNKQSGFWTKYSRDTIFSENTVHNIKSSTSASGPGMGFQYGPENVWFLFNKIYNTEIGFYTASASGPGFNGDGIYSYFIGNEIYNIYHNSENWNPTGTPDCIQGSGFCLRGGPQRYIIGNTIVNFDGGISVLGGGNGEGRTHMVNNIMINRSGIPYGHHLRYDDRSGGISITNSEIDNNLFFQEEGEICIITNANYLDCKNISRFNSLFGKCENCIEANPQFVNPSANDFRLQSNSPAIDAGTSSGVVGEVFDRFYELYGIDIRKDIEGTSRPQGAGWDIGAYEYKS